jgi:hypothetical protein
MGKSHEILCLCFYIFNHPPLAPVFRSVERFRILLRIRRDIPLSNWLSNVNDKTHGVNYTAELDTNADES